MFGVALDRIQMRFDLPGFLCQRVEAGNDGLLFGQQWNRNFLIEEPIFFDAHAVGGAFTGGLAQFDERRRADQPAHECGVASLRVAKLERREVIADDGTVKFWWHQANRAIARIDLGQDQLVGANDTANRNDVAATNLATTDDAFAPEPDRHLVVFGLRVECRRLVGAPQQLAQGNFGPCLHS